MAEFRIARRTALAGLGALTVGSAAGAEEGRLERVRRAGVVRFGTVPGQPPYCYKDLATGEWRGFMVDLVRAFAGELGVAVQPVESTWGNSVLDVQADKVDVFFGLAPTPQRAQVVDFTVPLYQNAFALIARPGFAPTRWAELNDPAVRVALELGTQYDQAVPELCPLATVIRLRTNNEALLTVQAGRADCQIIVVIFALTTLSKNPSVGHLVVPEPLFGATTNAMVAKEADPAWRRALDGFIERRRKAGAIRALLVENLEKVGVPGSEVPPQLLF